MSRSAQDRRFTCAALFCPEKGNLDENGFCPTHGGDLRLIMARVAGLHDPPKPVSFACVGVNDRGKPCGRRPVAGESLCSYHRETQRHRNPRCAKCRALLIRNVLPDYGLGLRCWACGTAPDWVKRRVRHRDRDLESLLRNVRETESDETIGF